MAREVICPRGARTRVLHIVSDSIPQSVRFTAEPVEADRTLEGTVDVERGGSVFGRKSERASLAARNEFRKGFFDSRYAVFITPAQDTRVVFQSRHVTSRMLFVALAVVVVLGAVAGLGGFIVRSLG